MKGKWITEDEWEDGFVKSFKNNLQNAIIDAIIKDSKKDNRDVGLNSITSKRATFDIVSTCAKIQYRYQRKVENHHKWI